MSFRRKIQYFLVQKLRISNRDAKEKLASGQIQIDRMTVIENVEIFPENEITLNFEILKPAESFTYLKYYKPAGIECTLNPDIADNLFALLPFPDVFPVGRLDKASEGLLLLTNDGRIYDKILRKEQQVEKEYIVKTDKIISEDFIQKMQNGIQIMGKTTLPCVLEVIDKYTFKIILTQGLNRQIRRMCYKLDYEVLFLQRIRVGDIRLGDLTENQFEIIKNPMNPKTI